MKHKQIVAYLDTGVSVTIPAHLEEDSEEVQEMLRDKFKQLLLSQDSVNILIDEVLEEEEEEEE